MTPADGGGPKTVTLDVNRRHFVACCSPLGLGSTLLPGALLAVAQDASQITVEMLEAAQKIAGLSFGRDELETIAERLNGERSPSRSFEKIREVGLDNSVPPAIVFNPVPPGKTIPREVRPTRRSDVRVAMPPSGEELAMKQAREADEEIAAGAYRGPLHGIPWGAKDLLAVKGTKTTWGASPYRDRAIETDATVYARLTEAGAILVAKLSMGALAQGDRWFGGRTRNPWNT
jgi:hypothetical protein